MAECREEIKKSLEGIMTRGEVEQIFQRIEKAYRGPGNDEGILKMDAEAFQDFEERIRALSPEARTQEMAMRTFERILEQKKEKLVRAYKQAERSINIEKYMRKAVVNGHTKTHIDALINLLVGDMKGRQKELTLEGRKNGILSLDMAEMSAAFDEYASFFGFKFTEEQQMNIAKEMDAPGSTGDKAAEKLVKAWDKHATLAKARKNELGANIGHLEDWRLPQAWDPSATKKFGLTANEKAQLLNPLTTDAERKEIYKKAKKDWIEEAFPRMNREKYVHESGEKFDDEEMRDMLSKTHDIITSRGLAKMLQYDQSGQIVGLGGSKSLVQRLAEHRALHFKTAVDWLEFNKLTGTNDVLGIMQKAIVKNAGDTALLEVFGPDPVRGFDTAITQAKHYDGSDKGAFRAQLYFDEIAGTANVPVSEKGEVFANAMLGLRQWMVAAKMGSVLLSQVNDVATYTAIARTDGLGVGKALKMAAEELLPTGAEGKKTAAKLGIASQSMINDVAMRYGEGVQGTKLSSRFANGTVKLAGMIWWTDSMKAAYQRLIAFHAADAAISGINDPHFQAMLERYGISDAEWAIIKTAPQAEISGQQMITPVGIKRLGETSEIREAAIKYAAMLTEEADIAIVSPGVRERALIKDSTKPGTLAGEFMRTTALFKTFTVALTTKVLPRIYAAEGTAGFRAGVAAQFALSMIIAGGISYQLKQLAFGRNPRDIETPSFWIAAAAQSGGLGIFSDFMFADYNRFGGDLTSSLAGPVGGFMSDATKLTVGNARQAMLGKGTHFKAEAFQFVKNYTPLVNLWYTRAALDHLLLFQVQESMNPGYLRRMRRRVESENNQTFYWDPQDRMPEEAPDIGYMFGGSRR